MKSEAVRNGINKYASIFAIWFSGHFVADLFHGNPFTWWEYFFIALVAMLFYMFFSWAWKSKEYKKREQ